MQAHFEDHGGFQRTALVCMAAAAAVAALGELTAGAAAAAVALAAWPGAEARRRRVVAGACAAVCGVWFFAPSPWLLPIAGGLLGLSFALGRREADALPPRPATIAAAAALAAAATLLLPLAAALSPLLPRFVAGAAYGLWLALSAVPLHLSIGDDPVEARLASLRTVLQPELRALAERAVAARRDACGQLPRGARADLRGLLDSLALATLQVAERAADLSRSASPALEDDLQRRAAGLSQSAAASEDTGAQKSYQRAAEALQGQLEHLRRLRRAKERAVARLHEEVANLERARFSLTLVQDPSNAAELDLLQARLTPAFDLDDDVALVPTLVEARTQ